MKFTSAIPLFCAALLGYFSFTRQSNATSVIKQSECTSSGLTDCKTNESDSHSTKEVDSEYDDCKISKSNDESREEVKPPKPVAGCPSANHYEPNPDSSNPSNHYDTSLGNVKEPKNPSDAQSGNGLCGKNESSNQNCSHSKGISQEQKSEMNPSDSNTVLTSNDTESDKPLNNLSELPSRIKSDLDTDLLLLDLTDDYCLPYYTEENFSSWKYSKIFLQMNDQSNLSLLTKAFSGRTVTDFNININSNEKNLDKLFEIIKDEKFKSLLFYHFQSNNEHAEKFVENLGNEDSFWSEMEYLDLWNFPKNQIIKTLSVLSKLYSKITSNPSKYKPLKLKKLSIIIDRTNYESIDNLNIPFIEELDLRFYHYGVYLRDIDSILPIFPNIKKLSIYVSSELEYFEIGKNAELEELEIKCETLKEEDKFVKYLKENTNLTSFRIRQYYEEDIEWIRDLPAKKKIKLK